MLRILYDDLNQKVKNIHDEMDLHHSYKKKRLLLKVLCPALYACIKNTRKHLHNVFFRVKK